MAMMTGDQTVLIEVSGVCNAMAHQTDYSVKIPYSSMSSTIQRITRQGGKIVKVTMGNPVPATTSTHSAEPSTPVKASATVAVEPQKKGFKSKKK
jgi:predicted dinucleotide-binding enzyme